MHHRGIELRAGPGPEDLNRLLVPRGGSVGPQRGHRVEGVGDGDDAGAERNLLAPEASRIAGAVEALVVVTDDRGELRVAEAGRHLAALVGMALRLLELIIGEAARLGEEGGRHL